MAKNTWIWIAVILLIAGGMFLQSKVNLFSISGTCQAEQSTLTYASDYIYAGHSSAQSFQPSVTGKIDSITIDGKRSSATTTPLTLEIKDSLTGTALWSYQLQVSSVTTGNSILSIPVTDSPTLTSGQTYYLVMSTTDSNVQAYSLVYYSGSSETYTKGNKWLYSGTWSSKSGDYYFVVDICQPTTCTPSWQTGTWSTCVSGTQTRTVTDANACGVTTGMPAISQTCSITCTDSTWTPDTSTVCSGTAFTQTSNCANTRSSTGTETCNGNYNVADTNHDGKVDRTELGVIINSWIAGTASRTDLASAIAAWMVS